MRQIADSKRILPITGQPLDLEPVHINQEILQRIMLVSPTTHFVAFAQSLIFRGAGIGILWPQLLATWVIGLVAFLAALARFRQTVSLSRL